MLRKMQLRNGMKVYLYPTYTSPILAFYLWVNTGSADEKKGEEGISHFIEHLLFKGTKKYKVGEIASVIEGAGGRLNAYTSLDQTVFHITISRNYSHLALDVLFEMVGRPSFDPQEIDNERDVVLEEIKRSADSSYREASQLLFSTVYKKHPYGVPVIGYAENIKSFSPEKIKNFFKSRYSPDNMSLYIVGDMDEKEMKENIIRESQKMTPCQLKPVRRCFESVQSQPIFKYEKREFREVILHMAWRVPSAKSKVAPALEVLALILGQGESSRLFKRLKLETGLVTSIGSSYYALVDEGLLTISLTLEEKKVIQALDVLGEELTRFLLEGPRQEELKKAQYLLQCDELYSVETVDGKAQRLGHDAQIFDDPEYFQKFLEKVNKVTLQDIYNVTHKYLKSEKISIVCMSPKKSKNLNKNIQKWIKGYQLSCAFSSLFKKEREKSLKVFPVFNKNLLEKMKSKEKPSHERIVFRSGTKMVYRSSYDSQIFSLHLAFLGGARCEIMSQQGLSELVRVTLLSGTKNHSEIELRTLLDNKGISLYPFSGRNTIGLTVSALSDQFSLAQKLLFDIVAHVQFDADIVEREKAQLLNMIQIKKDFPDQIAMSLFCKNLFQDHPYSRDPLGTKKTIKSLTKTNINRCWKQTATQNNLCVVLSGNFPVLNAKSFWQSHIEQLPIGKKINMKTPLPPLTEDHFIFESSCKEQSHIMYGMRGLTFNDSQKYVLHVLQAILAGQGGRLFTELRDKASLAYTVAPVKMEGIDTGLFGAYIGCSPEKSQRAISLLEQEFYKVSNVKVSSLELERAKRFLIGKHDIHLQKSSSIANYILFNEIYDVSYRELWDYQKYILNVTEDDVLNMAQKLFSQHKVTVVVGRDNPF